MADAKLRACGDCPSCMDLDKALTSKGACGECGACMVLKKLLEKAVFEPVVHPAIQEALGIVSEPSDISVGVHPSILAAVPKAEEAEDQEANELKAGDGRI